MAKILGKSQENHRATFPKVGVFYWPKIDISWLMHSKCSKMEFKFKYKRLITKVYPLFARLFQ